MTTDSLLTLLFVVPFVIALLNFACHWTGKKAEMLTTTLHVIGIVVVFVVTITLAYSIYLHGTLFSASHWIMIDSLSAIFLGLLGIVALMTGIHAIGYMRHEYHHGGVSRGQLCNFYGLFHLFVFTMLIVVTTNNMILMWAGIEATTLSSAFLVGLYGKKTSLEAAWKYIIICSVGVAFGLYGTILVYANAANVLADPHQAIFWDYVLHHANQLDMTLMHLAFIFVLIGFGTKMGLFPMHAWLPDAHSESPSPISALLSAVLLNCALLVIMRYYAIISQSIGSHFLQVILIVFGSLSILIAAFFIIVQKDMKRLLAYSSMENMGVIALALGIGGPIGIMAALLHTINHSLGKSLLFCGSGNVLMKYGSRDMGIVRGMFRVAPFSAALILLGALALGGMPPFSLFSSEFMTFTAIIQQHHYVFGVILLIVLTIVLCGLVRMVAAMLFGDKPENIQKGELSILTTAPMLILTLLLLVMGVHIPHPVVQLVESATHVVSQQTDTNTNLVNTRWLPLSVATVSKNASTQAAIDSKEKSRD